MKQTLVLVLICFISYLPSFAQNANNSEYKSKYKLGFKLIGEKSGYYSLTPTNFFVFNGGIQVGRTFGNTKHSLESGVYYLANTIGGANTKILYQNICVPVNYRFDKTDFYLSVGSTINYLFDINSMFKSETNKIYLGYNLNLGFEKSINKSLNFFIEARYSKTIFPYLKRKFRGFTNYGIGVGINYTI